MDTEHKETSRFVVLIPHRDSGKVLAGYRDKLFAAGLAGAHAFPVAAPLAGVSRPLSREELKELARNIRELAAQAGGKITASALARLPCLASLASLSHTPAEAGLGRMSFLGPALNLPPDDTVFPPSAKGKILFTLLPPVLCAALADAKDDSAAKNPALQACPALSFRAAALANLSIRPLPAAPPYSFEWRIGPLVWLPKAGKKEVNELNEL